MYNIDEVMLNTLLGKVSLNMNSISSDFFVKLVWISPNSLIVLEAGFYVWSVSDNDIEKYCVNFIWSIWLWDYF